MKYTVVIDVDIEEYPDTSVQELTEVIKTNIENSIGRVDSIGRGDDSNIGWHYVTRWHEDDFKQMLEDNGVYVSEENIDILMYACRHMDESQVEAGWNHMQYMFDECSFEPEFKCEVCGEEITEEENGICEFCHEELENDLPDKDEEEEE